jgi:ABC-type multidrug transport system fused ATPase/permease subunit
MMTPTVETGVVGDATAFELDYYNPNEIHPKTQSLPRSAAFFASFVVRMFHENRRRKLLFSLRQKLHHHKSKRRSTWRRKFSDINKQRRNLVKLADYRAAVARPSFLFLILGALMTSVIPHFNAKCIQLVATSDSNMAHILEALLGLGISSTLCAFFTGMRGSLFWIAGTRINYNIRVKLHRNLLLQEAAFFDSNETGYFLSRLNSDVNKIGMVISYHVNVVFRQLAQFIFGSVYLIKISPRLSLYAFAGIFLVGWISVIYGEFNRKLSQKVQDTFADGTAVAETSFSMSETIRAFDGVSVESKKYERAQSKALELEEVQAWGYGTHKFVSDTLQGALQIFMLLACWRVGVAGGLPASQLTAFMFYTNFVLESSNEVGDQWAKIQGAIGASTSVFDLIRRVPRIRDPPRQLQAAQTKDSFKPANGKVVNGGTSTHPIVELKNFTVQYGTMDIPALDAVDLGIHEGDRVAIVGRSGSGKSSILRSLLRFYDPCSGSIELEGKQLKDMSRKEMAAKLAVVEQEPSLFPMSLMENVLYGIDRDSVDPRTGEPCYSYELRQKVEQSLVVAGLSVHPGNDLNLELDTRVGDGGRALSGGQR